MGEKGWEMACLVVPRVLVARELDSDEQSLDESSEAYRQASERVRAATWNRYLSILKTNGLAFLRSLRDELRRGEKAPDAPYYQASRIEYFEASIRAVALMVERFGMDQDCGSTAHLVAGDNSLKDKLATQGWEWRPERLIWDANHDRSELHLPLGSFLMMTPAERFVYAPALVFRAGETWSDAEQFVERELHASRDGAQELEEDGFYLHIVDAILKAITRGELLLSKQADRQTDSDLIKPPPPETPPSLRRGTGLWEIQQDGRVRWKGSGPELGRVLAQLDLFSPSIWRATGRQDRLALVENYVVSDTATPATIEKQVGRAHSPNDFSHPEPPEARRKLLRHDAEGMAKHFRCGLENESGT